MNRQSTTPGGDPGAGVEQTAASTAHSIARTAPESNPLLQAAMALAAAGYPVFPCKPRGKTPLTKRGVNDASQDHRVIRSWWARWPDANIGLSCRGLVVLDLDGPTGVQQVTDKYLPPTPVARTGGGGWHYYFRAPDGVTLKNRVKAMPGVDIRTDGGYVIAPPSIHTTGTAYQWADGLSLLETAPAPCPGWLLDLLATPSGGNGNGKTSAYAKAALRAEAAAVAQAPRGTRNDTLNRAAFCLGQLVADGALSTGEVCQELEQACRVNGLWAEDPQGVRRTISSGMQAGSGQPRKAPQTHRANADTGDLGQADTLVALAEAQADLFRDPEGERWATVPTPSGRVTFALADRGGGGLRDWLARRYREETGRTPNATALAAATLQVCAECAVAPERQVALRVAEANGALWVDLGAPSGEAVRVTAHGWEVTRALPEDLRFRRPPGQRPLPYPLKANGRGLRELRELINVHLEADWTLLVAWLLCALRPGYPYPVLVVCGEQGSAKSTTTRILRFLVDPFGDDGTGLTRPPNDIRDLFAIARNCHVIALDNVTSLPAELSDSLAALATGAGLQARRLYTDGELVATWAKRPIIINGVGAAGSDIAARPDLLDRALCVTLAPIPDEARQREQDLWEAIRAIAPFVLADLLDAVACAFGGVCKVRGPLPRMADAAAWVIAAEPALAWTPGTFMRVYGENRREAIEDLLSTDPIAPHLRTMAADGWEGTVSDLLRELDEAVPESERRRKSWPGSADALGKRLTRLAPALRRSGVLIDRPRKRGERKVRLWQAKPEG